MTVFPVPLREASEEERQSLYLGPGDAPLPAPIWGVVYACQPEFDPDGEYIPEDEPGSLDKTNEAMLFFGTLPLLGACVYTNLNFWLSCNYYVSYLCLWLSDQLMSITSFFNPYVPTGIV